MSVFEKRKRKERLAYRESEAEVGDRERMRAVAVSPKWKCFCRPFFEVKL